MGDVYQSLKGLFPFVRVDWDFVLHGRSAGWLAGSADGMGSMLASLFFSHVGVDYAI